MFFVVVAALKKINKYFIPCLITLIFFSLNFYNDEVSAFNSYDKQLSFSGLSQVLWLLSELQSLDYGF